jgi:hypothetical protein
VTTVILFLFCVACAFGALVAIILASAALSEARDTRAELQRLAEHLAAPRQVAALERATGTDLLDLPPRVRVLVATWRAVRHG